MLIVDVRRQHRPDRPHDCAVCRTTAARVTAPETEPIRARATIECGHLSNRTGEPCAKTRGHRNWHMSRRMMDDKARRMRRPR